MNPSNIKDLPVTVLKSRIIRVTSSIERLRDFDSEFGTSVEDYAWGELAKLNEALRSRSKK